VTGNQAAIRAALERAGAVFASGDAEIGHAIAEGGPEAAAAQAAPKGSRAQRAGLAGYCAALQQQAAEAGAA
jgi:hypothetical protein